MRAAILSSIVALGLLAALGTRGDAEAGVPGPAVIVNSPIDTVGQDAAATLSVAGIVPPGLGAWTIDVAYDPAIVSGLSCVGLSGSVCNPDFGGTGNTMRFTGVSALGLQGNNSLGQLKLHCDDDGMVSLDVLVMTFSDTSAQPIEPSIINGNVTCRPDSDLDGCANTQEQGPNALLGGLRDANNFWDFFDVPTGAALARDQSISSPDIFGVLFRFNTSGNPGINPLSTPPATGYHTSFDRGAVVGSNNWNRGPADGSIASTDVFAVLAQFNHSCA